MFHFLGIRTERLLLRFKPERSFDSEKDQIGNKNPLKHKRIKVYSLHFKASSAFLPSSMKSEYQVFLKFSLLMQQWLLISDNFRLFAG